MINIKKNIQEALDTEQQKDQEQQKFEEINKLKEVHKEMNLKLEEIIKEHNTKQYKDWWRSKRRIRLPEGRLTVDQVKKINGEMERPHEERNYYVLDKILQPLEFFQRF